MLFRSRPVLHHRHRRAVQPDRDGDGTFRHALGAAHHRLDLRGPIDRGGSQTDGDPLQRRARRRHPVSGLQVLLVRAHARSGTTSVAQVGANGSGRVRHGRGVFVLLGSAPCFQVYALLSLIPSAAAADVIVFPSAIFFLSNLTCASVTIGAPAPEPPGASGRQPRTRRQYGGKPAKVVVVDRQK